MEELRRRYPRILAPIFRYDVRRGSGESEVSLGDLPLDEQFRRFVRSRGEEPTEEIVRMFIGLAGEEE